MSDNVALSDGRYELLIHGYVRQSSSVFDLNIPLELFDIVSIFYPKLDAWSVELSDKYVTIDNKNHTMRRDNVKWAWDNGYGVQSIKPSDHISNQYNDGKNIFKIWRIKFVELPSKWLMIGVIPETKISKTTGYFCSNGCGYGYSAALKRTYYYYRSTAEFAIKHLSIDFKKDEIVQVILYFKENNQKHCCLGYRADGDIEEAMDNLDINESYHFAVSFYDHQCVQLVP